MKTTTFTLTTTQPTDNIDAFAHYKGYQDTITSYDGEGVATSTPNPLSTADFCGEYFKKIIVNEMGGMKKEQIYAASNQVVQSQLKQVDEALKNTIEVEIA
jgi:hypothetical protein